MTQDQDSPCVCRRRFLTVLGTTAAAAATLAAVGCGGLELETLTEDVVIDLSQYPELETIGQTALVTIDELAFSLAITRLEADEGAFIVTGTECSHNGCEVKRKDSGWECPCHGARFDLDGELRRGPANQPLVTYDFEVEGDQMTIFAPT